MKFRLRHGTRSRETRFSRRTPKSWPGWNRSWTSFEKPATRSAPESRRLPNTCPGGGGAPGTVGPRITTVAEHVPVGWGAPVYAKLDADLAAAMMSINAVKAVEIGAG